MPKKLGAKKVSKSNNYTAFIWLAVVLAVAVGWSMFGKNNKSQLGINEVSEVAPIHLIDSWDFDNASDMGSEGWVAKRFNTPQKPNPSNFQQLLNSAGGTVLATSLSEGWMLIPGTVGSEVALVKSKGLILPEAVGDLRINVVASAVIPPAASPKVVNGVTIPGPTLKGQLQLGNGQGAFAAITTTAKPEVSGSDLVYMFRVSADTLKKPGVKQALEKNQLSIFLSSMGIKLTQVKIDRIEISSSIGPSRTASPAPSTTTLSGNLHVGGSGEQRSCVLTTAQKVDYQILYTGPQVTPVASPTKGCPASLSDFVRKDVTVTGVLLANQKILRVDNIANIVLN